LTLDFSLKNPNVVLLLSSFRLFFPHSPTLPFFPRCSYAKQNGGQYDFVFTKDLLGRTLGLPLERRFWDDLFQNAREWGCLQYQQDW
jgi:hypothetical protein